MIRDDSTLNKDVKMMGIAVGNDAKQIGVYKKQFRVAYPVLPDKEFKILEVLGYPATPFMYLATPQGKILLTHGGSIGDLDAFLKEIRELHKNQ